MARQIINVGTEPDSRNGDNVRVSFQKTNANFSELYSDVSSVSQRVVNLENSGVGGSSTNTEWSDGNGNTFAVIPWVSGKTVTITATPFETTNAITYDTRTDSNVIYFSWDQVFIDDVWDGGPNGLEGANFEISFDDGNTWFFVQTSGYSGGNFFYFSIPYDDVPPYTFTYDIGQNVIIRYNRGNSYEPWFDLEESPIESANSVYFVVMSAVANGNLPINGTPTEGLLFQENMTFAITDDYVNTSFDIRSGSQIVTSSIDIRRRFIADPYKVFCTYEYPEPGNLTVFWDAKLYIKVQS